MSVVVAVKDKDRFVIGCDTRMSGDMLYTDSYLDRPKGKKLNNNIIVAGVGNIGLVDVFAEQLKSFDNEKELTHDYILFKVLFPILEKYKDSPLTKEREIDGDILIAKGNNCYIINANCTIDEVHDYRAIGSGEPAAIGSLLSTFGSKMSIEDRVALAVKITGKIV